MAEITPSTSIKLPAAVLIGAIASVLSIGAAIGVSRLQMETVQKDLAALEVRIEGTTAKQDARMQRNEETTSRIMEVLGRIDERTSTLVRQSEKK
jgi:hypothetical protein